MLDAIIRHRLGIAASGSPPVAFFLGYIVCFFAGIIFSQKSMGKRITILIFCIPFCTGMLSVCLLRNWKDPIYLLEFALGFYVPVLWFWTMILLSILLDPFPACRSGNCRGSKDFTVSETCYYSNKNRPVDGSVEYKCKCGDEYVRRGKKFMALDPERRPNPYKKLIGFHKWADDTER
jgi:hypothetical protein